jgi:predicted nucleic acid-binding protein
VTLNNNAPKPLTEKELKEHVQKSIKQMGVDFKKTKAQEINYALHLLKIVFYEYQKDFKQSIYNVPQM